MNNVVFIKTIKRLAFTEGGGNGLGFGFEATEEIVEEREVFGATEFENENEVGGVVVAEIGLERSVIEDFFGEKRV